MTDYIYQNESQLRLGIFLGGFILLGLWEWLSPKRKLTQAKIKRWLNNIALIICSTVVVRGIIPIAAVGVAYWVNQEEVGLVNYFDIPFEAKVIIAFILLDLTIYFQHVIFHIFPVLWRIHRVHHSDLDFDITTGLRFHPIEIVLSILIKFSAIIILGTPVLAVVLFEVALNFMSMFTHSNIRINNKLERILRFFLVTPDMHRIHHSVLENETNSNFSFNISLWDRLFSTYMPAPQEGHQGMTIGLERYREPHSQNFKGLLTMPFTDVRGYAINYRDMRNNTELARISALVDEQTKSLSRAKKITDEQNDRLRDVVERLIESERYQHTIIERMVDGFIAINERGIITEFNPAAEKIFGYSCNEILGKNVNVLMPKTEAIQHDGYLKHYKYRSKHRAIGIYREIEGQRKDGTTFPIEVSLTAHNASGEQVFTAAVRDITERVEAEKKILQSKENAEKANRAKTEFLNAMSHELRTPLNAIIGFSDLISREEDIDPLIHEQVIFIQKAGVELLNHVENVLNLSKIDEGEIHVTHEEFPPQKLADDCIKLITPLAKEKDVLLNLEVNSKCTTIKSDQRLLKQVLLNLLSNAIKYIKDGSKVTLQIGSSDNNELCFSVVDDGPGIDAEQLNKIFQPFERLDWVGSNIAGTGLSLLISKKIIELMGGTIGVESEPGKGSRFWVNLPI